MKNLFFLKENIPNILIFRRIFPSILMNRVFLLLHVRQRTVPFLFLAGLAFVVSMKETASAQGAGDFAIAVGPPQTKAYAVGIEIASMVNIIQAQKDGIVLNHLATSGLLESLALLDAGKAEFAFLSASWDDLIATGDGSGSDTTFGHNVHAVATLWRNGSRSSQLVARRDVNQTIVYEVVRTIFENLQFLKTIDSAFNDTSLDGAVVGIRLPLHAGARRYYEKHKALSIEETASAETAAVAASDKPRSGPSIGGKLFVVYFGFDDATIDSEAEVVPDRLEALGEELTRSTIRIAGYTDSAGDAAYNMQLGQKRIDAVVDALRSRGIQALEVVTSDFGESSSSLEAGGDKSQARNRRVEIFVEPHEDLLNMGDLFVGSRGPRQSEVNDRRGVF